MNVEMKKVNEKINHIEELMTNFISQLAAKGLQTPAENLEVRFCSRGELDPDPDGRSKVPNQRMSHFSV